MNKLADFFSELKRRRVLRVAAVYAGAGFIVAVLAIIIAIWALSKQPSPDAATIRSIAVLPLDNLSGDPEQVYLVEKIHDSIISSLNHLRSVEVRSRTSTLIYDNMDLQSSEIARELNVDALVIGTVSRAGNQVGISVQLIHGSSDGHLWDGDYVVDLSDILIVYRDIAAEVAREIGLVLSPEEQDYLASTPRVNPEAYDLYSLGWYFRNRQTIENMLRAQQCFEQAVALDSTFSPAWEGLAFCYLYNTSISQLTGWNPDPTGSLWREALDKAFELDPDQSDALVLEGIVQYYWVETGSQRDFAAAEASFRRALDIEPSNVNARYEYGLFLYRIGRPAQALAELRLVHQIDPFNINAFGYIGRIYLRLRQYEKAIENVLAALEIFPDYMTSGFPDAVDLTLLMQQGRYAEASEAAFEAGDAWTLLRAEWAMGNMGNVSTVLDTMIAYGWLAPQEQDDPVGYARYYSIIGEKEKVLDLAERALEEYGRLPLESFLYYLEFDPLRAEPRFKALLEKTGLPEVIDENGQLIQPIDETLEAYNAPGSR